MVDFVETCVFCDDRFAPYIYEPRPTKKQIQENMDTYNRPATKSADPGLSKHHHQRRKSQGDFGRRANNYQKRGQDVSSSHHGKADPYHKKESKRKVNQGVKNGKWSKDKGTDGDGHKQASHPSFTKPQPLALEGDKSSTAYDGLMRRLDNKERDNKLGHSGESNGILADRARNGSRFVSFSRFDIEDETNIDNQRVKMGSNNIKDKHVAVNFQQPQAENEDSASEKIRLQRENASLMGSRGQFSSNY